MTKLDFFAQGWIAPQLSLPAVDEAHVPIDDSSDWSVEAAQQESDERYESYCDQKYEGDRVADSK